MLKAIDINSDTEDAEGRGKISLIFAVEDVDKAWNELRKKGIQFVANPTDRPEWGIWTAHFTDPDGNIIEINSPRK
jgi:lactoylglutathione lyase